ncbi:MAG: hypothetical protein FJZ01_08760 [Candidatus Sericytochromatia bacterium]|nr:hypothetical protein [Candidatus Tanganyikabacteria bacterium]
MLRGLLGLLVLLVLLAALVGCQAAPRLLAGLADLPQRGASAGGHALLEPGKLVPAGNGILTLVFRWPTGSEQVRYRAQQIPDSTAKIDVSVFKRATAVATASVTRQAGQDTATVSLTVPTGSNFSVRADAYAAASGVIARATAAGLNIVAGKSTAALLYMASLYTPAVTSLDHNAGGAGDTITLTGVNFKPAWAGNPVVALEGTAGSSVSATVTAATDTAITFKVPANSAIGRVEVTADGVPSYSTALFWVAGSFAIDATRAPGDSNAATSRDLLFDDAITFTATNSWALRAGKQAGDYGTPPSPTWPAANDSAAFSDASGPTTTLTALPVAGNVPVKATLGATSSAAITARISGLGAFADTGVMMTTARRQFQVQVIGPYLYAIGGWSMKSVERAPIDPNSGDLGSFTAAGVPQLNEEHFDFATVVVGDYLYAIGGDSASIGRIYKTERALINSDGTLGSWQYSPANDLPIARRQPNVVRLGRYVYLIGGDPASGTPTLLRARILDAQGNLGPWEDYSTSSQLQTLRAYPGVAVADNTVYVLGGNTGSNVKSVEAARADADGNLGPFGKIADLAGVRQRLAATVVGDSLIVGGGQDDGGYLGSLEFATLTGNPAAPLTTFAASTRAFTVARTYSPRFAVIGKWLYAVGGLRSGTGVDTDAFGNLKTVDRARIAFPAASNATLSVRIDPTPGPAIQGLVSTLAGSQFGYQEGVGAGAKFSLTAGVAYDGQGNLYVSDFTNSRIRKVVVATGQTSLVAGNGQGYAEGVGEAARFNFPQGLALDGAGGLYVADYDNNAIRKIELATGQTSIVSGTRVAGYAEGTKTTAQFNKPIGLAYDGAGNLFVSELGNHMIRKVTIATGQTSLVAGSTAGYQEGVGAAAKFNFPIGLAYDGGSTLYVADLQNQRVRKIDLATGQTSLIAGGSVGDQEGVGATAQFNRPYGLALEGLGTLYVSEIGPPAGDTSVGGHRVRRIALATGATSLLAGGTKGNADGFGSAARFDEPAHMTFDPQSKTIFLSDWRNTLVRAIK